MKLHKVRLDKKAVFPLPPITAIFLLLAYFGCFGLLSITAASIAGSFAVKWSGRKRGRAVKSCSPFSAVKWRRQKSRRSRI